MDSVSFAILAVAALVLSVTGLIAVVRRQLKSMSLHVGNATAKLEAQVADLATTADHINHAVNNQPPDHPTLVNRVAHLEAHHRWLGDCVEAISDQLGTKLPARPDRFRRDRRHHV